MTRKWSILPAKAGAGLPELPTNGPTEATVIACVNDAALVQFVPSRECSSVHRFPSRLTRRYAGEPLSTVE